MTTPSHPVVALSGGKDARARITRWMNVYVDQRGQQWPGSLCDSREVADEVSRLYTMDRGPRRHRAYVLKITAPSGYILVKGPWTAPGTRR